MLAGQKVGETVEYGRKRKKKKNVQDKKVREVKERTKERKAGGSRK